MDQSQALDELSDLLTRIQDDPYDLRRHSQVIKLAISNGLDDYIAATRQMFTDYWPAGDDVWLPRIEAKVEDSKDSVVETLNVLELFEAAEMDYLSIPILQKHIEFLIDRHACFNTSGSMPEELGDAFTPEWTRTMLGQVVQKGAHHLTKSHLLWNTYFDWEMDQLENSGLQGEERNDAIIRVEDLLLNRLKQPHLAHDETFQLFSSFTTKYKPSHAYEKIMVTASKGRAAAVEAYQRRERLERSLDESGYSPEAYSDYLTYERRARKIDLPVISTLYERAISDTAKRRFNGDESAELALCTFWLGYYDVLRTNNEDVDRQLLFFRRATRSIPGSGAIWANYIRFLESTVSDSTALMDVVSEIYNKAFSTGLLQKDVEEIVPVVLARAGLVKRINVSSAAGQDFLETAISLLEEGIKMVREVSPQGDPRYRLEKFLSEFYTNVVDSVDLAGSVWEKTAKHYKSSYFPWMQYIENLIKQQKYDEARAVFNDTVHKRLDWPEVIFDAWVQFEHLYGTVEEIYDCLSKVERAQNQVNSRRAKEAEKAYLQAAQQSAQESAASNLINEAVHRAMEATNVSNTTSMKLDDLPANTSKKRRLDAQQNDQDGNKKIKTVSSMLKRDREHTTVFVADLPSDVSEDDLNALFKDCGAIREVKISTVANTHVAAVEFHDNESIPAALTKDKKRIRENEIAVHLAWQSTLYITNFPESADDEYIRQVFGQYGLIFDVRWPSKKFKPTRRFCYVQFVSREAAQAATALNGKELEPGLMINVLISDPERKKERTDANADDKEVRVSSLSKFVTEKDLEKLFRTYGSIKDIRVIKDDAGLCKGTAFIEFEDELSAQRALQANNHDLKNRRIAVTLADSRVRARRQKEPAVSLGRRADIQNCSVRIRGLPSGTQEGLLQQALAKIVLVKRVEVFEDVHEATAELETAVDAGKLVLLKDPLVFHGKSLQISEEIFGATPKRMAEAGSGVSTFVPRAALTPATSRPRAGLGTSKHFGDQSKAKSEKSQDDFRKLLG